MSLAGWAFADLALLFGAGAGVITALYLLRMRRRQVTVPFAALWERVTRETETRRLWRRLRRLFSWLIQLLVLGLLCLALGDPRPEAWFRDPVTLAIVVDRSASMGAPAEPERTRFSVALDRASAELRALGPVDRALVITAGTEIAVPAPLGREPSTQIAALRELAPQPGEAELPRALALARAALAAQPGPRILVITDGALDEAGIDAVAQCISSGSPPCQASVIGGDDRNVAITAFAARRYPGARDKVEVLVEVHNLGGSPARVELDVDADGLSVGGRTLELGPGEARREILRDLDAARARLVARVRPTAGDPDGAAALGPAFDDIAWAVIPPIEPIEIVLVADGTDLFLEAALLALDDYARLGGLSPAEASPMHPAIEAADVVVYDVGDRPLPALPRKHLVVFDPHRRSPSPFPIAPGRAHDRPRLTEQARHPLLAGVVFKDVNLARGTSFELQSGDQPLVKHLGEPVVVLREEADRSVLGVGFDPRQSDLPLRIAFPLLVANTVDYFAQRLPGFVASLPIGSDRELTLAELGLAPDGVTAVEIVPPEGEPTVRARVQDGRLRLRAVVPGVHAIRALDGQAAGASVEVAVNQASATASNLASRLPELPSTAQAGDAPPAASVGEGPVWTLVLFFVLAIVGLEWGTYHRRRTV